MPTIPRAVPLALTAAVTVATAGLLTGCGSAQAPQSTSPTSSTSGGAAGSQMQVAGAGSSSAPTAPPTVPGLGGLTVCRSAALKVTVDSSQAGGAAGSAYYPVNFTNTSAAACGLYGYPGMSFVTAAGGAGRRHAGSHRGHSDLASARHARSRAPAERDCRRPWRG